MFERGVAQESLEPLLGLAVRLTTEAVGSSSVYVQNGRKTVVGFLVEFLRLVAIGPTEKYRTRLRTRSWNGVPSLDWDFVFINNIQLSCDEAILRNHEFYCPR